MRTGITFVSSVVIMSLEIISIALNIAEDFPIPYTPVISTESHPPIRPFE